MNRKSFVVIAAVVTLFAASAQAASFVVPTDDEMVQRARAIAVGTVEGSYVQESPDAIETIYEIRLERGMKGTLRAGELLRVATLGGMVGERGLLVTGEARFRQGERVLLFLTRDNHGHWRTTDLTLGKFKFVTSTAGGRMLVREMEDVVGWDHAGNVHREKVRKEEGFLRFIEERVKGKASPTDYVVSASDVTLQSGESQLGTNATAYPAATYTDWVNNQPTRWSNISSGIPFYKRTDMNIPGAADGGVSTIQNGLAAWTNEPGSNINLVYAGQLQRASADFDSFNIVEFNDPQGRIGGSWTGAGTVATCFVSFTTAHTFLNQSWLTIFDADVVFQDGYTATNASFAAAMTHELGHGIGWRHSNQNHQTGGACNSAVEECTSAAIMNSSVSSNFGFTLQPWDINAAQSVYPGTTPPTCTAPSISAHPTSRTITAGSSTTLTVTAGGTTPLAYQWYVGTTGNTSSPIGSDSPSLSVAPTTTTSYWVRVNNACGSADSATATVTVTAACTPPSISTQPTDRTITAGTSTTISVTATGSAPLAYQWYIGASGNTASPTGSNSPSLTVAPSSTTSYWVQVTNPCGGVSSRTVTVTVTQPQPQPRRARADFDGDNRSELLFRNSQNMLAMWDFNGRTAVKGPVFATVSNSTWRIEGFGDFNGDGRFDILYREVAGTRLAMWLMNGTTILSAPVIGNLPTAGWNVEAFGDFNGDGRTDMLARGGSSVAMWEFNGTTVVNSGAVATVNDANWLVQGAGDFDGDGAAEVIWRHQTTQQLAMWDFSGRTLVNGAVFATAPSTTHQIQGFGDFDGDGRDDILWRNTANEDISVWDMNGRTVAANVFVTRLGSSAWRVEAIGDYDGDAADEVMWFNTSSREVAMWDLTSSHQLSNGSIVATVGGDFRIQPPFLPVR